MSTRSDARWRFPALIEEGQRGGSGRRTGTDWKGTLTVALTLAALLACGAPVGPERRSEADPSSLEDLSRQVDVDLVSPPVAPAPSDDDRIAFVTSRHGGQNPEIYVMDADGSNLVNLTRHPGYDGQPAWWRGREWPASSFAFPVLSTRDRPGIRVAGARPPPSIRSVADLDVVAGDCIAVNLGTSHPPGALIGGEAMASVQDTTELLLILREGDRSALDLLMPRIYDELHRIAHRELVRRGGGGTLGTTGLVHEAYLKLVDQSRVDVEDRTHFLAVAATAMRHIVIDYARRRAAQKRGGDWRRVTMNPSVSADEEGIVDVIALDEALGRLQRFDERMVRVVESRFFAGLTVEETAEVLGVSPRTVDRVWQKAKAWLYREMDET